MAEPVALFLKADGTLIEGDSTQHSLERANSIECLYFEHEVMTAREASSGMATGRRQYKPILIRKRIDRSTPLIQHALVNNQVIDAEFRFYRPNPKGDGTTEQFFTLSIFEGRLSSMRLVNPDSLVPATAVEPPLEEVGFVFERIEWTYMDGGVTATDSWRGA